MNLWNLGIFWKTPKNSVCPNNPAALPIKAKNALSNSKLLVPAGAAAAACCWFDNGLCGGCWWGELLDPHFPRSLQVLHRNLLPFSNSCYLLKAIKKKYYEWVLIVENKWYIKERLVIQQNRCYYSSSNIPDTFTSIHSIIPFHSILPIPYFLFHSWNMNLVLNSTVLLSCQKIWYLFRHQVERGHTNALPNIWLQLNTFGIFSKYLVIFRRIW